jgi:hypothetical protein
VLPYVGVISAFHAEIMEVNLRTVKLFGVMFAENVALILRKQR